MEPSFNREWEHAEYVGETTDFIRTELRYADRMIRVYEADANDHDRNFARAASQYLACVEECFQFGQQESEKDFRFTFFEVFPDVIRNLTTALFQRREATVLRAAAHSPARSSFAPSEVTVEYPLTIRAAEAVNEDFHQRVRGFYDALYPKKQRCEPPLVNLYGSTAATLLIQHQLVSERGLKDKVFPPERLQPLARLLIDLSCISLPRWSSQHVRTYAFAAHEHMHRLLWAVVLISDFVDAEFREKHNQRDSDDIWVSTDPQKEALINDYWEIVDAFKPIAGEHLVALQKLAKQLHQDIRSFMTTYGGSGVPYSPVVSEDTLQGVRNLMAWDFAVELLCDTGATVIAGPAFLFAFSTVYTPDAQQDTARMSDAEHESRPRHPATIVRILVQLKVLDALGFTKVAKTIRRQCQTIIDELDQYPLLSDFEQFLTGDAWEFFERFIDVVATVALTEIPQGCYDLARVQRRENTVLNAWRKLAQRVESKGGFMPSDLGNVRPADLINAIWWKRCCHAGATPSNRLAWRVALKNCLSGSGS